MEVGIDFKNILSYNENMAKGMNDKLFFLNKINFKKDKSYLFVDFGCADGSLLDTIYPIFKDKGINAYFIGYDISDSMIELAKAKFSHSTSNVLFTTSWDEVMNKMNIYPNNESILILSSVIHEVYSYAESNADIDEFWYRILNGGFNYICVRDMMCSKDINRETNEDLRNELMAHIAENQTLTKLYDSFRNIWGISTNNKNFVHFLLKYRWQINWQREVNENYFPIYFEDFIKAFNEKYNISYLERFRVPFLEKCWNEDFNIEINDYTHIKSIFELKRS